MFIPGETIRHRFNIPFNTSDVTSVIVSYRQNGCIILKRTVDSIEPKDGHSQAIVNLTEEESLLFADCASFFAQLNVIVNDSIRCVSKEIRCTNGRQHIREKVTTDA